MKSQWISRIFSAFLIAMLAVVALPVTPVKAAATTELTPTGDGFYTAWTNNWNEVEEGTTAADCTGGGSGDGIASATNNQRESVIISLASIPNGSTITSIEVIAMDRANAGAAPGGTYATFVRFNGTDSANSATHTVAAAGPGNICSNTRNDTFDVTDTVKAAGTTLEIGVVKINTNNSVRVGVLSAVVTYTDTTAPALTSFTRQTPATSPTNANTLTFRATFSEGVQNVNAADFTVTGTTATIANVTAVNASTYDITVSGGNLNDLNGTVGINLAIGQNIADLAGNSLPTAEPTTDDSYVMDNTAPTAISIVRLTPATSPTNADTLIFRVTFNEDVQNVSTGDFDATGTTAGVTNVTAVNASTYDVTISGGNLVNYNGTAGLEFDITGGGTQNIQDLAGNDLPDAQPSIQETYLVDNTVPTVTINQAGGQADPTSDAPINFTAVFNEAPTGFATGDISFTGSTVGGTLTGTVTGGPTIFNVAVTGMTTGGNVVASIGAGVATDAAGNNNAAATFTDRTVTFVPKVDTTTSVSCTPNPVTVFSGAACTVTVTRASGTSTPGGTVTFSNTGSGAFSPATTCTLAGAGASTSCSVTYTPSAVGSGIHDIFASYGGDANFNSSSGNTALTVNQATSSVTVTCPPSVTYTGSAQTPCTASFSTSDGLSGALIPTYLNNTDAGTATANATYAGDANHASSNDSANFTIGQATSSVMVTCPGTPQPYTGSAQTPCTAEATGVGITLVDVTASLVYSNNVNAGVAIADASWAGDTNHTGNTGSGGFTINQATSTVTVTCPASVIYAGSPQTPCTASYSTSDGLSGPLTPTYLNNTDVGTATANATYAGDANHAGSNNSADFTIDQSASTVTVTCPPSVTYSGSAQTPCTAEATGAGIIPVDVTASLVYSNNVNVGAATADASWAGDTNHTGNTGSSGFAITQATSSVTVTCPAVPQLYTGSAQTPCTASFTTSDGLSGSLTPTYSNNTNVGTATANATYAGDANHATSSNSGTFDISQATSSVTVTCPPSVTYGGSAQTPCTASFTTSDGLSGSLTPTYSNNTNVGTATANATYAGDANHASSSNSATFDISQATSTVTVTCPGAAQPYTGSPQIPCTASYSTSDGLSGPLTSTYLNNIDAGTATANATYAGDANHAGSSNSATFTISQATSTVTVTCPGAAQLYTESPQTPCTASFSTSDGLSGSLTPTYLNNTNVGTATANATYAGDANHAGSSNSATFDISQATSSVTVTCPANVNFTGSALTPCTAEATGVGMTPVDVTASLVYSNNVNVGAATADASWAGDANHTGNTGSSGFTITQATSTVTVTCPASVSFTGLPLTPCTAEATGAGMTPVDVTASLVYSNNANAGAATADASWAGDANHTGNTGSGGFTITSAGQTITVVTSAPPAASNGSTFDVVANASSGLPVTITTGGSCTGGDTDGTATITMTSGTGTCSVYYDQAGDANYSAATQVQEDVTATEGPAFTSADNTTFDFGFPGSFTVTAVGSPSAMTITLSGPVPAGAALTNTGTGSETLSSTAATPAGVYNLILTADNGVAPNAVQNFTLTVKNGPAIGANGVNSTPDTGDGTVSENESIIDTLGITQLTVEFSQDVNDPADNTDPDDVTNPANYKLVRSTDGVFATVNCRDGVVPPDISISVDSVTYSNGDGSGPFVATLSINGGFPLNVAGFYRLYVCGTTSIVDANNTSLILAGDGSTPGTDFQRNFRISTQVTGSGGDGGGRGGNNAAAQTQVTGGFLIPVTGFAPHQTAPLPAQPADKFYKPMGEMTIEIPTLGIKFPIVGASITNKTWDLTWLQNSVAYLEGSAYPTLAGNTVLTAHVLDANNNLGPFSDIKGMQIGQMVYIHANGQTYVYQVQENRKVLPRSISKVFKHEEDSWITLVTCEDYNAKTGVYTTRRMVRAVLISVIPSTK